MCRSPDAGVHDIPLERHKPEARMQKCCKPGVGATNEARARDFDAGRLPMTVAHALEAAARVSQTGNPVGQIVLVL